MLATFFAGAKPRLLPASPLTAPSGNCIAFHASTAPRPQTLMYNSPAAVEAGVIGPFTGQDVNVDWLSVGAATYGGYQVMEFVFDLDAELGKEGGRARGVTPMAGRVRLGREGDGMRGAGDGDGDGRWREEL